MNIKVIAISGKKGSGKDTLGLILEYIKVDFLYDNFNSFKIHTKKNGSEYFKFKQIAEKVKKIVSVLTDCSLSDLEDEDFKNSPLPDVFQVKDGEVRTYRWLLITTGTGFLRNLIGDNINIDLLINEYNKDQIRLNTSLKKISDNTGSMPNIIKSKPWIITDLRFINEAEIIKQIPESILIRINRKKRKTSDNDISEVELDNYDGFDYVIDNDGTIEQLIRKVKKLNIF
jgi:dephospho-CoA kinase